ncbi:hypothetical protein [Aquibacillus albus]|uniref:Uncharacterized protein n=1 Tax=Aquibacillus albus TaxID=1168171 RepID=A0ABS2N5D7_9BACI|nr:hypothetical protein [Aquibacillus albus]MBM7573332.1 hypothetical protein [Aquibacillus albus]
MIQVIGTTDLYFNSDVTFLSDINYYLTKNFKKYKIISHHTNEKKHQMRITFTLHMKEKYQCKSLLDYNSYAYDELKKRLPANVHTTYMQTIDIRPGA